MCQTITNVTVVVTKFTKRRNIMDTKRTIIGLALGAVVAYGAYYQQTHEYTDRINREVVREACDALYLASALSGGRDVLVLAARKVKMEAKREQPKLTSYELWKVGKAAEIVFKDECML
jgi:hypothetical protein